MTLTGWPAYHQSTVHSSALMYDIDKDGIREVALATFNGEVLFFRYFQLPTLLLNIVCILDLALKSRVLLFTNVVNFVYQDCIEYNRSIQVLFIPNMVCKI
jgi:hypothetical protein